MIDNLELIKPLLTFESEDDFYFLQILQRKKENDQVGSNSRVIKDYHIRSVEYLEERYDEIRALCNLFDARAYLRLNKRSYEKVAYKALINMANSMSNREFKFVGKSYVRAVGQNHNDKNKKWILDIDDWSVFINSIQPDDGQKVYLNLKSKNGGHLITKPFRLDVFREKFPDIEVHKDNPTNLYIP